MRRFAEFLVDILPLDASGRRAVDETLADWRHEAAEAQTVVGRVAAGVRGLTAVVVAVTVVAARDVASADTFRIAGAVVGAAVLMGIGFSHRTFEDLSESLAGRGLAGAPLPALWASMLPQTISLCIPLALLAPPVRRVATRSLIGPCVVLMVLSAANLGWITPQANQWFRQTIVGLLGQAPPSSVHPRAPMPRGHAEYTVAELAREMRTVGARGLQATANLSSRGALLAMVPVALLIGVQARRFAGSRRWRFGAGLLAYIVTAIAWVGGMIVVFGLLESHVSTGGLLWAHRTWLIPVSCMTAMLTLAAAARRREPRDEALPVRR